MDSTRATAQINKQAAENYCFRRKRILNAVKIRLVQIELKTWSTNGGGIPLVRFRKGKAVWLSLINGGQEKWFGRMAYTKPSIAVRQYYSKKGGQKCGTHSLGSERRSLSGQKKKRMCCARPAGRARDECSSIFVFRKYNQAGSLWRPPMTAGRDLSLLAAAGWFGLVSRAQNIAPLIHSFSRHVFVHRSILVGDGRGFSSAF